MTVTNEVLKPKIGSIFKRSLPLLVSFFLLFILMKATISEINFKQIADLLRTMNLFWLCIGFFFAVLPYFLNSYRFSLIINEILVKKIYYKLALKITWLGGFFSLVTPFAALGDLARAGLVKWMLKTTITKSVQCVLFDRGVSIYCLILFIPFSIILNYKSLVPTHILPLVIIVSLALILILPFLLIFHNIIKWPDNRLGYIIHSTIVILKKFLKHPVFLLQQIFVSLGNVVVYVLTFWALAHAVHFSFDFFNLLLFAPILLIINNLPFFYQGLGGREAMFILLLPLLAPHVSRASVFTTSLGYGALTMFAALVGGLYLLGIHRAHKME